MPRRRVVSDRNLNAFFDGELKEPAHRRIARALDVSPTAHRRVHEFNVLRRLLRRAYLRCPSPR